MIQARHHPFYVWFFRHYSNLMIRKDFSKIHIIGEVHCGDRAILMIGNHFSWWDGFFANYLNNKLFRRTFHVMMLEEQLRPRMFLNKAGAFSIEPGSRSVVSSIRYAAELLLNNENILVMYPQGQIQSLYNQTFRFEKGISKIMAFAGNPGCSIVFYAAMVDYFSSRKPSLDFYLKQYDYGDSFLPDNLERAFNEHFQESVSKQMKRI